MTDEPELRYADCPSTEAVVDIAAAPHVVWALVTDIHLPSRFSSELSGADWRNGATAPSVGARFVGRNQHGAIGTWETTSTITALEQERTFEWTVGDLDHPSSIWRFTLEPSGDGTRLVQWMQMGPARSGINMAIDAMPTRRAGSCIAASPNCGRTWKRRCEASSPWPSPDARLTQACEGWGCGSRTTR